MTEPLELKNVRISTVQPSEKTHHPATLNGTLLDLFSLDVYIPIILFYKPNQEHPVPSNLISLLKDSLSKVLVPYFPFAGRWVRTHDDRFRELQCTDEGVPFIEASVNEDLKSVLNMGNFRPNPQLSSFGVLGLDPNTVHQDCDFPMPALFVQATEFNCGGVALNVTFNHLTGDAHTMVSFMTAWSQISLHGETPMVPSHDRSLIFSREAFMDLAATALGPPTPQDEFDSNNSKSAGCNGSLQCSEKSRSDHSGTIPSSETKRTDPAAVQKLPAVVALSSKILHVKREAIENLKLEAAKEKLDVTAMDLITAHIWRSLYNLPETQKKASGASMATFVEGRKRFHGVPEQYVGNVIVLTCIPPISSQQMSFHSHSFAANIVHNTVQAITPMTWKDALIDTIKTFLSFQQLDYTQVHLSSWHRFALYDLSFDRDFGNPIFACCNLCSGYLPLGQVIVLPPPPQHSRDIIATLQFFMDESNGTAEALYTDPKFLSLFCSSSSAFF